jgi:secreted trypsin-like serine protease
VALVNARALADDLFASYFCGGGLVADDIVLTAAHCVAGSIDAIVGVDNLCSGDRIDGRRVHVDDIEIHRRYDPTTLRFDLALLSLSVPMTSAQVRTARTAVAGEAAVAVGRSIAARGASSCRATVTRLVVLPGGACAAELGSAIHAESMFCARSQGGVASDTCVGDSGGAVIAGPDPDTGGCSRHTGAT